jgi:hypothetical protein
MLYSILALSTINPVVGAIVCSVTAGLIGVSSLGYTCYRLVNGYPQRPPLGHVTENFIPDKSKRSIGLGIPYLDYPLETRSNYGHTTEPEEEKKNLNSTTPIQV